MSHGGLYFLDDSSVQDLITSGFYSELIEIILRAFPCQKYWSFLPVFKKLIFNFSQ